MDKQYTRRDAEHILAQLERVTDLNGNNVFRSVELQDNVVYYDIEAKNDVGTAIVALPKAKENA